MSETGMMAVNRYRLKNRAAQGHTGARLALRLLGQTDKLLGVILLGNNFVNSASASLATVITFRLFGQNEAALGLGHRRGDVCHPDRVRSHAQVIAATRPDAVANWASYPLTALLKLFYPVVWFVNLFVKAAIRLLRVQPQPETTLLTPEELRVLVLESGQFIEKTPQHAAEPVRAGKLHRRRCDDSAPPAGNDRPGRAHRAYPRTADDQPAHPPAGVSRRLRQCGGLLHVRKVLHLATEDITVERLLSIVRPPYFVPAGTPLFTQLQNFQRISAASPSWWMNTAR